MSLVSRRCPSFAGLAFGLLCTLFPSQASKAQGGKFFYEQSRYPAPARLLLREMQPHLDGGTLLLFGELEEPAPSFRSRMFWLHLNTGGAEITNGSIHPQSGHAGHRLYAGGIAVDSWGQYYMAGASGQGPGGIGGGSERTLTSVARDGRVLWSRMQPNYAFESVGLSRGERSLIAFSGPYGNGAGRSQLMFSHFDRSGQWMGGYVLRTATDDVPLRMVRSAQEEGFFALGLHDSAGARLPMLVSVSEEGFPQWAMAYDFNGAPVRVSDLAQHRSGALAIVGSLRSSAGWLPMILLIGADGSPLASYAYEWPGMQGGEARAVAAFSSDRDGFLLAGDFETGDSALSRASFILRLDLDGQLLSAASYTEYAPQEEDRYAETLRDIVFLPASGEWAAGGELLRSRAGREDRRAIWVVRAPLDGQDPRCGFPLQARASSDAFVRAFELGSVLPDGDASAFSYQQSGLGWSSWSCEGSGFSRPAAAPEQPSSTLGELLESGELAAVELMDLQGRIFARIQPDEAGRWRLPAGGAEGLFVARLFYRNGEQASMKMARIEP
jgi:hypothetical protein